MAAINIVLNAVDKYSSTLTGLNQGLELVGKGLGLLKDAAGAAFDAVSRGVELARIGGAFQEQRNQFENLAKSYGLVGQQIIDTVKETSANTISEFDSIAIATKAVAAGLQGQELNDALAYVKRWSEATGESFQSAAERIFTSLSSGRFSVLRQMGLVIENGAKLEDVTRAISAGLQRFGDTGFNAADKLDALNASQDDFIRKIGQGINDSAEFQSVLGGISDAIVQLVKDFDPTPITNFIDKAVSSFKALGESVSELFPRLSKILEQAFDNPTLALRNFAKFAITSFYSVYTAAATTVNDILETFSAINSGGVFADLVKGAVQFFGFLGGSTASIIEKTVSLAADAVAFLLGKLGDFIKSSPKIADFLGIDATALDFRQTAEDLKTSVRTITGSFEIGFDKISKSSEGLFDNLGASADTLKTDINDINAAQEKALRGVDALFETQKKFREEFSTIKIVLPDGTEKEITKRFVVAIDNAKKAIDKKLAEPSSLSIELADGTIKQFDDLSGKLKIKPEFDTSALDAELQAKLSADINVKLDQEQREKERQESVSESEIFAALVKIIKDALINGAIGEGTPLAVAV